jgi:hypothetical protein
MDKYKAKIKKYKFNKDINNIINNLITDKYNLERKQIEQIKICENPDNNHIFIKELLYYSYNSEQYERDNIYTTDDE